MCGIAGYVGADAEREGVLQVRVMMRMLHRRGPDSEGECGWQSARLGHRRLAILDLSPAGHQPMLSDDGRIGVVFNGCIYNFVELRQELEKEGHRFRSNCDTEVLVRGYETWGFATLLPKLRGMFAIGIWDDRSQTLFLARDRMGVKPLLYSGREGSFAFASTVPALHAAGWGKDISAEAILEYLEFGYISEQHTVYEGVQKLPPAGMLVWHGGRIVENGTYWKLGEAQSGKIGFFEAVEETERLLIEAVRLRLQADVPIGALLSAGVDSSLVCWALARLNTNVRTYSVGTPGDEADETAEAAKTARRLGIPHEVVDLGDSGDANILDEAVAAYGEPFGCTSALGMLQVSRMIRERAKVVLTGDGGDDVFLGYPFQRRIWTAQRLAQRIPEGAAAIWQRFRPANGSRTFKRVRNLLDYATGGLGAVTRVHDGLPYFWQRGMLGERLAGRKLAQREIPLSMASARRVLTDVLHYEQTMTFAGEFMTKVDGATMHYSLEARSPLLDHVLWDFAATLPYEVRFHGGQLKAVLRELLRRHVSPELASRAKSGFTIPVGRWLVGRWRAQLEWLRNDPLVERDGWLAKGAATRAIAESEHKQMAPLQLWHVLALERWLRRQNGKSSCERL